jgi:hypothetical protein
MSYLSEVMNNAIVLLEKAPTVHRAFDECSPKEFITDFHGSVKKAE